jgi:hypothetical protein
MENQQELLSQYQGTENHEQSMRDFAEQVNAPVEVHSTDMKQPIEVFGSSAATPLRVFHNAKDRSYNLITGGKPKLQAPLRKQRIHVNCNPDVQVLWQMQDVLMDQITTAVLKADVQIVQWKDTFMLFKEFVAKNGRMPSYLGDPVEKSLSNWVRYQRHCMKKLSEERVKLLESISGWFWGGDLFSKNFEQIKEFVAKNGRMPSYLGDSVEKYLYNWVRYQRRSKKKLSEERVKLLESISGWFWEKEDPFPKNFEQLKKFVAKNDRMPSQSSKDPVEKFLGVWVSTQRQKKKKLSEERVKMLELVNGWLWEADPFPKNFEKLEKFVAKNGRMPPQSSKDPVEKYLYNWVRRQRKRKKKLSEERVKLLESVSGWLWEKEDPFPKNFEQLKKFVAKNDRMPSQSSKDPVEKFLGVWVSARRQKKKKLSEERVKLLESISGWFWEKEDPFPKNFEQLKKFVAKNDRMPSIWLGDPVEKSLGSWVSHQRQQKKKLSEERVKLLESVSGWFWSAEKPTDTLKEPTDTAKELTEERPLFDCCVAVLLQLLGPHGQVNSPLLKFMKTGQKKPEAQLLFPQTEFKPMMEAMLSHIKATNLTKAWLGAVAITTATGVVYALETVDSAVKLSKKVGLWNFNGESFEHLKKTYNLLCVAQESNGQWSVGLPVTGTVHFAVYQEVPKKHQLEPKEKPAKPAKKAKIASEPEKMVEEPAHSVQPPEAAQPTKDLEEPVQLLEEVQQCKVAEPVEVPVLMAKPSERRSKDLAEQVAAHARKEEQRVQENARLRQQILELTDPVEIQRLKRQLGLEADTYAEDEHSPEHKAWKQSMNRVFAQLVKDHTQVGDKILYLDGPNHRTTDALQGLQRDLYVANWDAETCAAITGATVLHGDVKDLLLGPWQHTEFSAVYLDVCTGHSHIIIQQLEALRKMPTVLGFTLTQRGRDSQVARVHEIERAILNRSNLQYVRNLPQFRAEDFYHGGVVTEFYLLR